MKSYRQIALVLAATLSAACVRTRTDPVTGRVDVDVESPTKRGEDWKAKMNGMGVASAATGSALAAVVNGQSTITVRVSGLTPGATHAWRVTEGKCGSSGSVVGSTGLYPTITVNEQGIGEGVARVAVQLDEAKFYQVRIFASASDVETVAVCGDLSDEA